MSCSSAPLRIPPRARPLTTRPWAYAVLAHPFSVPFTSFSGTLTTFLLTRPADCLKELTATIRSNHPIILLHEADVKRGGAPLAQLRGECPEDLQPDIFEKGWAHTIYMRIVEFQRVSLKTIVEAQRDTAAVLSPLPRLFPRHP